MGAARSIRRFAPLLALLGVAAPAWAGRVNVPCSSPSVFPGAAVNVVVLPFSAPPEIRGIADVGRELARLSQAELLLSIARFGSVGAVQLFADDGRCDPEEVLAKLLDEMPGARETVRPGRGVVLVWGRIFRDGDDLYLQTFVRFTRRAERETLAVRVGGEEFRVALMGQAFGCVPRKLSMRDLQRIDEQFRGAEVLYNEPSQDARRIAIPSDGPFSYYVVDIRDGWMRVEGSAGGPGGWLPARVDARDWSLRSLLPELYFVEGITGWLRDRVGAAEGMAAPPGTLEAAARAIVAYQESWRVSALLSEGREAGPAGFQPLAVGIPLQVRAFMAIARPGAGPEALDEAESLLARAVQLVPYSSDARNIQIVVRLARAATRRGDVDLRAAVADLERALANEPGNALLLGNVASAYRLLLAPEASRPAGSPALSAPDRAQIEHRLQALAALSGNR